ncbi:hypothetical protein GWK47_045533 [Chionoecetes opilio]|uniref:Uncharacterized protein n=1 Tax=Chionoecetes opilio TaxID=41210 RepID=A0A8J5CHI5_CHIOP|nr:hypothetical protein GWK47_045533 [Chionoecetes opilio]
MASAPFRARRSSREGEGREEDEEDEGNHHHHHHQEEDEAIFLKDEEEKVEKELEEEEESGPKITWGPIADTDPDMVYFDYDNPTNLTVLVGHRAALPCTVLNLNARNTIKQSPQAALLLFSTRFCSTKPTSPCAYFGEQLTESCSPKVCSLSKIVPV